MHDQPHAKQPWLHLDKNAILWSIVMGMVAWALFAPLADAVLRIR